MVNLSLGHAIECETGKSVVAGRLTAHPQELSVGIFQGMLALSDVARTQYGGKRGLVLHLYFAVVARTPLAQRYRALRWTQIQRLVFVCKGNICRSPFASGLARKFGLKADSYGLEADDGKPAAASAIRVAQEFGVDLSEHAAKSAPLHPLSEGDLLIGFEPRHLVALLASTQALADAQITAAGLWLPTPNLYIHDPYGLSTEYFRTCFDRISMSVKELARQLPLTHGN